MRNQQFTPSLNKRLKCEQICNTLKGELKLDDNISFESNVVGSVPVIHQPDTPMIANSSECMCSFGDKFQIHKTEMKLEISYTDNGSIISDDQNI